jgi:hypothetical protein
MLGLAPVTTAAGSSLPDPRRPDTRAPISVGQLRAGGVIARSNHVPKAADADRRGFESTGARVVDSEEGLLVLEVRDEQGAPLYIAAYDTKTPSGIGVIGLQFIKASEIASSGPSILGVAFGPQSVAAHKNGTNHWHNVGFPFHDNCSYVYNWANGDSTFHICAIDATLLQYVATGWGALLGGLFNPVIGFVAGLLIFSGIQYFKNADGSIDLFGPNASIVYHYGWTYYWGSRGGWYWHYPYGSVYYGYARRDSTGVIYRTH